MSHIYDPAAKTQTYANELSKRMYFCIRVCVCVCCAGSVDKLQSTITDDAGVGLALETLMVIFICIFFAYIQSDQLQMSHFCFLPQPHTNLTGQNLIHTHTHFRARALSPSLTHRAPKRIAFLLREFVAVVLLQIPTFRWEICCSRLMVLSLLALLVQKYKY